MDFKVMLHALRSIGFATGSKVARYSIIRDLNNWLGNVQRKKTPEILPGRRIAIQKSSNGYRITFEHASLTIQFLTDDLILVTWQPGLLPVPYSISKLDWDQVAISAQESLDEFVLSSDRIKIIVGHNGVLNFYSAQGVLIRSDLPPCRRGDHWYAQTQFRVDEHIYGLGERASSFDLMGGKYTTWNTDPGGSYGPGKDPIYICTPVYMAIGSTGSYLIFYENTYPATFDFQPLANVEFSGGSLRYYFFVGAPAELLNRYTELTGKPALPPRWVLGYHQSRWGYREELQIRSIVAGFESAQLPLSSIHLDIDYMEGFRVFTIDKSRFPDLNALADDLQTKDIRLVTILDPGVKKDTRYDIYSDGLHRGAFCGTPVNKVLHGVVWPGWAAFPDFTNPKTRDWWGENYSILLEAGISGFWHDMNEPVSFSAWGDTSLPHTTIHDMDGRPGNHLEAHNIYGFLMNKAGYDALRKLRPDNRPWLVTRSGWAGLQRYAWNWTGDVASTWEALRQTLITILGLSISGHVFSGSDIGGFSGNPSSELYLRWLQFSTFVPFFRTHSAIGTHDREPWVFGEPYTSIIRKYLHLRYRLIPYLYTLAWQANQDGNPLVLPMFWFFPDWREALDIDDQFFLGNSLMVAPVITENCHARMVIIPPGEWYSYWDDKKVSGPASIEIPIDLENIPVFVRAGSILPLQVDQEVQIHIYLSPVGSGKVYLDAGDGYDAFRIEDYSFEYSDGILNLHKRIQGEYYPTQLSTTIVIHGGKPIGVVPENKKIILTDNLIKVQDFSEIQIQIESPSRNTP